MGKLPSSLAFAPSHEIFARRCNRELFANEEGTLLIRGGMQRARTVSSGSDISTALVGTGQRVVISASVAGHDERPDPHFLIMEDDGYLRVFCGIVGDVVGHIVPFRGPQKAKRVCPLDADMSEVLQVDLQKRVKNATWSSA